MSLFSSMRRRRRSRDDRGVTAIEAAIILPVFLTIVVGIIEFGLVFKDQLAVSSSVRAGARLASAEPRVSTFAADAAAQVAKAGAGLDMTQVTAMWVYKADSTGHPIGAGGGFGSCTTSCDQFTWSAASGACVQTTTGWSSTQQDACQGEQDSVGIYMQFNHQSVTSLFFSSLTLSSYTVMRLEPIPGLQAGGCK
jgi:Flp pilus assembly protein TadG